MARSTAFHNPQVDQEGEREEPVIRTARKESIDQWTLMVFALHDAIDSLETMMRSFLPPKGCPLSDSDRRLRAGWKLRLSEYRRTLRTIPGKHSHVRRVLKHEAELLAGEVLKEEVQLKEGTCKNSEPSSSRRRKPTDGSRRSTS